MGFNAVVEIVVIQDGIMKPAALAVVPGFRSGDGCFELERVIVMPAGSGIVPFCLGVCWQITSSFYTGGSHAFSEKVFNDFCKLAGFCLDSFGVRIFQCHKIGGLVLDGVENFLVRVGWVLGNVFLLLFLRLLLRLTIVLNVYIVDFLFNFIVGDLNLVHCRQV